MKKYSRFRLVSEPLTAITHNEEIRKPDFPFSELLKESKYPVRLHRRKLKGLTSRGKTSGEGKRDDCLTES